MTDPTGLRALAGRVERAKQPGHQLDLAIIKAAYPELGLHHRQKGSDLLWSASGDLVSVPAYTSSLDAAMTLVPERWGITLERYWLREPGLWWSAHLSGGSGNLSAEVDDVAGAALALTAAALRARAAMGEGEG